MHTNKALLEERLNRVVHALESVEDFIKGLDMNLPKAAKERIVSIVQSKEIGEIIEGIKEKRPPRLALIGRSGVGKSSLINALTGSYVAKTSAVKVGTVASEVFTFEENGETLFEIIDTRGFSEDQQAATITAEEELKNTIQEFNPDAFLMLTNAADRSTLKDDVRLLKKYSEKLRVNVPIITVITRVDALAPARVKEPDLYTEQKKRNIREKVKQVKDVLAEAHVKNAYVIPISSYIEWSHEQPERLSKEERQQVSIQFDGRYNIDRLMEYLEENMDFRASVYMMMHQRLEEAIKRIAHTFVVRFSAASAGVAVTPIPASDIFVLVPIQILEVSMIAYLAGETLNAKAAREFILSLGGVTLAGLGFRFIAQQGSKFMNLVIPGSGSAISSGVAYSGTYAIGKAAIAYYIDGKSTEEVKVDIQNNYNHDDHSAHDVELGIKHISSHPEINSTEETAEDSEKDAGKIMKKETEEKHVEESKEERIEKEVGSGENDKEVEQEKDEKEKGNLKKVFRKISDLVKGNKK